MIAATTAAARRRTRDSAAPACRAWTAAAALVLAVALALAGPASAKEPAGVAIAAASDLKYALDDLRDAFRATHPAIPVEVSYGASGTLFAQLVNRAPFDVFLSADVDYPHRLADAGQTLDRVFSYAVGRLVVWAPRAGGLDVAALGIRALEDPRVRHVAIANPAHAPYGRAAEAALRTLGLYAAVQPKLVLGENVAQAAQFVQSGAADVGLISLSLALAPPLASTGAHWEVPRTAYPRLEQGGCILSWAKNPAAARAFRDFLLQPDGRAILQRHGFLLPG